jgi:hypothetical protein
MVKSIAHGIALSHHPSHPETWGRDTAYTDTWRIRRIIELVKQANPKFYPRPVIKQVSPDDRAPIEWLDRPDDWLTLEELIVAYDELGEFLHANSPYGPRHDVDATLLRCQQILSRIVALLNEHVVYMPGNKYVLNVQMNASLEGKDPNGHVACAIFEAQDEVRTSG